jgi:hypothetical protein
VLFARIKGVPEDIMDDYVEHLILRLGLLSSETHPLCQYNSRVAQSGTFIDL